MLGEALGSEEEEEEEGEEEEDAREEEAEEEEEARMEEEGDAEEKETALPRALALSDDTAHVILITPACGSDTHVCTWSGNISLSLGVFAHALAPL